MAGARLLLPAKCPLCLESLLCPEVPVDGLPSVELAAVVVGLRGRIHLSPIYGSVHRRFLDVPDIPGSEEEFSCPRCRRPLPVAGHCSCGAALVEIELEGGGLLRFCARNGCREHHLEFEEADDAFVLFESQAE